LNKSSFFKKAYSRAIQILNSLTYSDFPRFQNHWKEFLQIFDENIFYNEISDNIKSIFSQLKTGIASHVVLDFHRFSILSAIEEILSLEKTQLSYSGWKRVLCYLDEFSDLALPEKWT
jgi:hypothetical protein